jgi:hypothetical protein
MDADTTTTTTAEREATKKRADSKPRPDVTVCPPEAPCGDDLAWNYTRLEGCFIDIQSITKAMRALILVGHDDEVRTPAREVFEEALENLAGRIDRLAEDGQAHFAYMVDAGKL